MKGYNYYLVRIIMRSFMQETRVASVEDIQKFKKLWKDVFGDSDSFIDWFFKNRFQNDISVCTVVDGKIANMMHGYRYNIKLRDKVIKSAMLSGFATEEKMRGNGYLASSFKFMMKTLEEKGVILTALTPVRENSYNRYEHYTVTQSKYIFYDEGENCQNIHEYDTDSDISVLYDLYIKFTDGYSGIIMRSKEDFVLKMQDYLCDNAKTVVYSDGKKIRAYCVYYVTDEEVYAVETVYDNDEIVDKIGKYLAYRYKKNVKIKVPTDCKTHEKSEIKSQGNMGCVNISKLLKIMDINFDAVVKITDRNVENNNTIIKINGDKTNKEPDFSINSGNLLCFLVGYKSLEEIFKSGEMEVYNENVIYALDEILPVQKCYVIDEY